MSSPHVPAEAVDPLGTKTEEEPNARRHARRPAAHRIALTIAWSLGEPDRVGEVAVLPTSGAPLDFGREDAVSGPRVQFFRSRPLGLEGPPRPLASPTLPRHQMRIEPNRDCLVISPVGAKLPIFVNGVECKQPTTVYPGDSIRLGRTLVLACIARPDEIPALKHFAPDAVHPFGEADLAGIVGESPAIWALRGRLAYAASAELHALFVGESGTGKELAVRAVHLLSPRRKRPLISENAAVLPSGLAASLLFGNAPDYPDKGQPARKGYIGEADGGLLFLDEIGRLTHECQAQLLRVLDEGGKYHRLGEEHVARRSDFRLLAATNADPTDPNVLEHDFFARFSYQVTVAPLRSRREDIPLLARHLVLQFAREKPDLAGRFVDFNATPPHVRIEGEAVEELLRREYRLNTRTLRDLLVRAIEDSPGSTITHSALPADIESSSSEPPLPLSPARVEQAMKQARGNETQAARWLGVSRGRLQRFRKGER